ncbi:hypothetical protein K492DRAFT_163792 [Lichtheimia hyalospora FSU 10163]|nr:hypothetical protein K492DRAFT_163792 [Lichtheimia hyalospora FSU 10163]
MSDRTTRSKRSKRNNAVSNVHYVGYVEDEESVEAIMKKFEELERIQSEIAGSSTPETPEITDNDVNMDSPDVNTAAARPLTEEQLEEVFKRTSAFTVKSAMIDTNDDDVDALELWQIEFQDGNTEEIFEEDDYMHVDDDFWDQEFGDAPQRPKRGRRAAIPRERPASTGRRGLDRDSIIAKYRIMQVQVQDQNGNFFMVKKRVSALDPGLPTYVKIPGAPIPRSWVHQIMEVPRIRKFSGSHLHEVDDILSLDLKQYGSDFKAIYMDPPLLLPGEEPTPGKIHVDDLLRLNIPEVIPCGFLFIWLEKEWLRRIVEIGEQWGFKYVENFCWIKKNINNQIHTSPGTYFKKSKLTLLVFRKEGDVELRHQRNPDCVFDFVKPMLPGECTESKPSFIYHVIETMLPGANYHPETNPDGKGLLQLWAKKGQQRTGWTTIIEKHN